MSFSISLNRSEAAEAADYLVSGLQERKARAATVGDSRWDSSDYDVVASAVVDSMAVDTLLAIRLASFNRLPSCNSVRVSSLGLGAINRRIVKG